MTQRIQRVLLAAAIMGAAFFMAASCQSPLLTALEKVDFGESMIFDCQRSLSGTTVFVSGLKLPVDDAKSTMHGPYYTIEELDSTSAKYNKNAYIKLVLTAQSDGDTIASAVLVLKDGAGKDIRTISANGAIHYLGAEGFVYISTKSSAGYFFSKTKRSNGSSLNYTFTVKEVTKLSQLPKNW